MIEARIVAALATHGIVNGGLASAVASAALDEIRAAIAEDAEATLPELGLSVGGELYRKGGMVRAFYAAR